MQGSAFVCCADRFATAHTVIAAPPNPPPLLGGLRLTLVRFRSGTQLPRAARPVEQGGSRSGFISYWQRNNSYCVLLLQRRLSLWLPLTSRSVRPLSRLGVVGTHFICFCLVAVFLWASYSHTARLQRGSRSAVTPLTLGVCGLVAIGRWPFQPPCPPSLGGVTPAHKEKKSSKKREMERCFWPNNSQKTASPIKRLINRWCQGTTYGVGVHSRYASLVLNLWISLWISALLGVVLQHLCTYFAVCGLFF